MMCLSDRSIFLARSVTVLHFGALCDHSTFTSTDARATDLRHGFCCEGFCCRQGGSVTSSVCVLAAARDVLTQQQQQ
jgi:hypothetical protein